MPRFPLTPVCVAALMALGSAGMPQAAQAASFDGTWSVVVITDRGGCDRAYRYPVRVTNGQVRYEGEAGVAINGRVDGSGRLRATISRGEQSASGSGRLSQGTGAGVWSGRSRTEVCSGRWEAEKRGGPG